MLTLAIGASGLVYIWAAGKGVRPVVFLLKPLTMLLIIALAAQGGGRFDVAVIGALLASVVGDVLLMLPLDLFVYGLGAFLVAHLFYVYALWAALAARLVPADAVTALLLAVVFIVMMRPILAAVRRSGQSAMVGPVLVYALVITLMVWRAVSLLFQPVPLQLHVGTLVAGALLFYASDLTLAWNRFVRPVPHRDALVMGTYFAAQWCFAYTAAHVVLKL